MRLTWHLRRLRGTPLHRFVRRLMPGYDAAGFDRYRTENRQIIEVLRRVLQPDSCCVDVGSHRGDVLRQMVALAPDGTHTAFEALPHLANALQARFPQVRVCAAAVGDTNGTADFCFVRNDPGYSGLRPRLYDRPDPQIAIIPVEVVTLDASIPANQHIALLKIDIEGGEYHALQGAIETIRRGQPIILFEAGRKSTGQYGVSAEAMYTLLTETLGYDLTTKERWLLGATPLTLAEFQSDWDSDGNDNFLAAPG